MINKTEVKVLKDTWRLVLYFWAVISFLATGLYSAGFIDLPATAGDVKHIRETVSNNKNALTGLASGMAEMRLKSTLRKSQQADIERRLGRIEQSQRIQQRDTKEILRLMIGRQ